MTSPSRTSRGTFWAGNVLIALYCIRATAAWSLSSHSVGKTSFSSLLFRRELSFVAVSPHHGAHITSLHRGRRSIHQNSLILRAQMDEIPDEDDANLPEQERVRKRDILKRKLGLGGGSDDDRVKLNTDGLFQGMPGIDSIIGSGSPKVIKNPPVKSDKEIKFRKQGEIIEENFLTSEEEEELKNEYEKKKQEAESFVVKKMSEGNFQFSEAGVTEEDGRKIADYIVEVERAKIRKQKNEERKKQTLEQWEKESRQKEDARVEAVIKDGLEYISERDPIAREIMRDWDAEAKENEEQDNRIQEMNEYQEMIEKKKNETTQAKIDSLSTQNVDFDDLFEESLNEIKKGRSEKLGGRDLGFYANTIELEESAAYVRGRKEEKQFQTEVDAEWKNSGEMGEIVPPKDMYEKRKLILISRKIVSARDPSLEATRTETIPQVDYGEEEGDDDDDEVDDGWVALEEKPMTAKETVQAYKELNAWREYRAAEKKNEDFFTRNEERINRTNFNKKSTEEIDAERFPDILRSQLKSDDSIEDASNDVLMKELMQEGVTTERAIRLIDKLLGKRQDKSEDDAIKGFLEYMRETFLAQNETPAEEEVSAKPKSKPIDLSELLRAPIFEDEPSASAQKPMSLSADSEPGLGSVGKLEPDRPMPPPSIPYVSPTEQAQQFDQEIPPPPDSPFFRAARASKEPAPPNEDLAADMFRNYVKRKGDDDETRGKQEAAFMDFLKYEEEMKKKLDDMSVDTDITDINEYADDVMSELKPRPG